MRVPVTESNPLSLYGQAKPDETSLAMAGATMNQLVQSKQPKNAAATTSIPGPSPSAAKRSRSKAS